MADQLCEKICNCPGGGRIVRQYPCDNSEPDCSGLVSQYCRMIEAPGKVQLAITPSGVLSRKKVSVDARTTVYSGWTPRAVQFDSAPPAGKRPKFHTKPRASSAKVAETIVGSERQFQPKFLETGGPSETLDEEVINLTEADPEVLEELGITASENAQSEKKSKMLRLVAVVIGLSLLSVAAYKGYQHYYGKEKAAAKA